MSDYIMLYITFPSREKALDMAKGLIEKKLIACGNIIDGVTSVYQWKEQLQVEQEFTLVAKSKKEKIATITDFVESHHPYEIPCILFYPVFAGNEKYLKWIDECLIN